MARIISIVNQKGGTGKSACTANLAVGLVQKNMKVLIVDADPQSDVSAGFGYRDCDDSNETLTALMEAVMKDEDIPSNCYIRHQAEGIDIICSNIGLAGTEVQLVNAMSREYVLKQILYGIKDQYDVVIIDCMPSLGMINLFVVPNHLTEQWGAEFLQLYPGANILVATKKDFEPANRKKFCARIAMGNYDAIIIGHSQFERIPISDERQEAMLRKQIDDLEMAIQSARYEQDGGRYTVKQIEKTRKTLQTRLEKLNQKEKKDQVVTFEELGVDHLYVDEAHS